MGARKLVARGLRALIFDAYGTLFDVQSATPACEALFPEVGAALNLLWRKKQLERTRWCVLSGRYKNLWEIMDDALASACRDLNLTCSPAQRIHLREQYLSLGVFPEVPEILRTLGTRYTLVILSHGTPHMLTTVAAHCGPSSAFAAILSVDTVRAYKPNPRAYELAEQTLQLPRGEMAYVSMNPRHRGGEGLWPGHGLAASPGAALEAHGPDVGRVGYQP